MRAGFVIDPYRIAGGKIAMHIESAGGQQRCPTTTNGLGCTRINHNRAARFSRKTNP